ncbi:MAG TPA: outer membrane protein assembly factor BamD [Polyangiaceae bacterium]
MSEPTRLSLETEDETEQLLLRAGRPHAPRAARERAWMAASGVLASSSLAAGSVAAKVGSVIGGKAIAVIAFTGLAAMGGAMVLHQQHRASESAPVQPSAPVMVQRAPTAVAKPAPLPSIAPAPVESVEAAPMASSSVTPPRAAAPAASVAPGPTESATSSVPSELAALQQARAALGAGDPARALSMLDAYGARFPHGAMAQEAVVLRIEALVRAGDRPAAQRAADAYLGANPQSPYVDRIRSLLGTNP